MNKGLVWVVDDDQEMLSLMSDFLVQEGFEVKKFSSGTEVCEELKAGSYSLDLILSDIQMPGIDGLELVRRVRELDPHLPIILVTAFGSIETAIEATRSGAQDYLVKPFKLSELSMRVDKAVELRRLYRDNQALRAQVQKGYTYYDMIGRSKAMRDVFELVDRVAEANANVLITGESGTGKEVVARAIHERGSRANKPFVAINCTAIPEALLESELFGHAKGSFTGAHQRKKGLFEEAEGGTLFLDEIGDLDMSLQAKLLRVIQERRIRAVGDTESREINVRIIAATHKDLIQAIREGRFREDLYYRLSVIPISLPPLRHRRQDVPSLAKHFLHKFAAANHSRVKGFTAAALDRLTHARWDGNVRELENLVERLVVLSRSEWIDEGDLPMLEKQAPDDFFAKANADMPTMEGLEKRYIQFVLEKVGGRKEKAAQILGINRRTLYRKEREYGLVSEGSSTDLMSDETSPLVHPLKSGQSDHPSHA